MFEALGRVAERRRWWVAATAVTIMIVGGLWGTGAFNVLTGAGFTDPSSESVHAQEVAGQAFGRSDADVVVLYSSQTQTVDDAAFADAVQQTVDALPAGIVTDAVTYWSTGSSAFVSADRHSTYVALRLSGAGEDERSAQFSDIEPLLKAPGLDVASGGLAAVNRDIGDQVAHDIALAEMISLPIVLVLLIFILGSVVAAGIPMAIGGLAILGSFTAIRLLTMVTEVSVFAINIVTLLGLGLAIDYGLFMVSRFREELRRGADVSEAIQHMMATAGRTIAVSGVTVAVALVGLLLFPQTFLRSMGYGGIAAVAVAATAALTVIPALLAIFGKRVDALSVRPFIERVFPRARTIHDRPVEEGFFYRLARRVMRRPVAVLIVIVAFLLLVGSPFLRVSFGGIDERALPAGTESRVVAEAIARDFPAEEPPPADVIVRFDAPIGATQQVELTNYVQALAGVPRVTHVTDATVAGDVARIGVTYDGDALSATSRAIILELRSVPAPDGTETLVGGPTAELVDLLKSLRSILPWMALLMVGATLVLLFLAFGSVVLPIKAVLMNVLSLGATFGVLVLIFQDGHLSSFLGFTSTGTIEATQPILMLAIAFGLSMDYELFILSRVKEQHDISHDNESAVAIGLQRSGSIVTSAALLLIIVIGAFSTSGITFIKLIGVGMIVAIFIDATIVRSLLLPATMRLLGEANWWSPPFLRGIAARYGIREGPTSVPEDAPTE